MKQIIIASILGIIVAVGILIATDRYYSNRRIPEHIRVKLLSPDFQERLNKDFQ